MFEHVGFANHQAYFQTINRLLKPHQGLYLHHAIARSAEGRNEKGFRKHGREAVAIARYIFPGGETDPYRHDGGQSPAGWLRGA